MLIWQPLILLLENANKSYSLHPSEGTGTRALEIATLPLLLSRTEPGRRWRPKRVWVMILLLLLSVLLKGWGKNEPVSKCW